MTRLAAIVAAAIFAGPAAGIALAHHGWTWAEETQSELTGTVDAVDMSPPHPRLTVTAADGTWTVELGNPNQTERSGFKADSVKPGDTVTALGNKAADGEKRIKTVRLTVGDAVYDLYPERIQD